VTRFLAVVGVAAAALVLATAAAAQGEEMPTELWSEFPLVQDVERSSTPSIGPFLPPTDSGTDPVSGDAPRWGMWALVAAAGLFALLVATRLARTAPATRPRARDDAVRLRPHHLPRPSTSKTLAQYAPSPSLVLADAPEEPWRSVVRRTGLLRSRYVVLEGQSPAEQEAIAMSKSFWNVGGAGMRERVAEDAWDDLMNDLRAAGWEPDPTRRSDFYVLLQPVHAEEEEASSIVPTLEAYGRAADDEG
jgi:hypothetical protein